MAETTGSRDSAACVVIRKASNHRDGLGWTVTKYDGRVGMFAPRVWVGTREAAELCRNRFKRGEEISLRDMLGGEMRLIRGGRA